MQYRNIQRLHSKRWTMGEVNVQYKLQFDHITNHRRDTQRIKNKLTEPKVIMQIKVRF